MGQLVSYYATHFVVHEQAIDNSVNQRKSLLQQQLAP